MLTVSTLLVDTDDPNGDNNNLQYTVPGYQKLGERFAGKAIELIAKRQETP